MPRRSAFAGCEWLERVDCSRSRRQPTYGIDARRSRAATRIPSGVAGFAVRSKRERIDVICGHVEAPAGARRSPTQRRCQLRDGFVSTRVLDIAWKGIGAPLRELLGRFDGIRLSQQGVRKTLQKSARRQSAITEIPSNFPVRGSCRERRARLSAQTTGIRGLAASLKAVKSAKLPVVFPALGNICHRRVRTRLGPPPQLILYGPDTRVTDRT
jgi:hypothetical protein